MEQTVFNNKAVSDYFQSKLIVIGTSEGHLKNDWVVREGFLYNNPADASFVVEPKVKVSMLMIKSGMLPSRNEFMRKLKQKGIKLNDTTLDNDVEIDVTVPSIHNELRLGKRFLEVVVPSLRTDTEWEAMDENPNDGTDITTPVDSTTAA